MHQISSGRSWSIASATASSACQLAWMSEMTATRMRLATLVGLAGVWAAASYFLWASSIVPGGLHLSGLPESKFFGAKLIHRAHHYESFFYWLVLGQVVATVV